MFTIMYQDGHILESTDLMHSQTTSDTLREESSQTNIILQYKLLAAILSAVGRVIQQS